MDLYCSDRMADLGEPLVGSAARAQRTLLLGHPKGQWGEKALLAPELAEITGWVKTRNKAHPGLNIRLFNRSGSDVELRLFPEAVTLRLSTLAEVPAALDAVFRTLDDGGRVALPPCARTLAVCTHGKHDRCCAKYGQALFEAVRAAAPADIDVVEASHLGGHRFAATALDLAQNRPARMYGRLRAEEAEHWLKHLVDDRVWLGRYRGRADLSPDAQVAEAQALALGAHDPIEVMPLEDVATPEEHRRFRVRWPGGETMATVAPETFEGLKGCGKPPETWTRPVPAQP